MLIIVRLDWLYWLNIILLPLYITINGKKDIYGKPRKKKKNDFLSTGHWEVPLSDHKTISVRCMENITMMGDPYEQSQFFQDKSQAIMVNFWSIWISHYCLNSLSSFSMSKGFDITCFGSPNGKEAWKTVWCWGWCLPPPHRLGDPLTHTGSWLG